MARSRSCLLALALLVLASAAAAGRPGAAATAAAAARRRKERAARAARVHQQPLLGLDHSSKQLRVLAHGDSITEGWVDTAEVKTPWTPWLQQQLQNKLPGWNVEVVNGGLGGAGVLDALYGLFQQQLSDARNAHRPYHFIVFEGGINDILLQNKRASDIFERMKEMWRAANADGSTVLVIPTLPTNAQGEPEAQRRELTARVRDYIVQQNAAGNHGLRLVDMETAFNYHALPESERRRLFDDGVHLTQAGYELMGQLVLDGLVKAAGI